MLLEIKDLTIFYGQAIAIEHVNLDVNEGEVVSIIGANGAGKSTIIRAISGIKRIKSGEILFQGKRIDKLPAYKVTELGLIQVPANRMVVAPMSVIDNLRLGTYLRKDRKAINEDLENIFDHFPILKERRNQMGGSLSGGEQQMLAIGRALMGKPKMLIMDEPSIGLSPLMVAEVGNIIRDIHKSGISILLVEQNSRMALKLSNRSYVLELGKVTLTGDASALIDDARIKKYYLGGT
jgi:branched-chain amino acid transport system ATP-binding protein